MTRPKLAPALVVLLSACNGGSDPVDTNAGTTETTAAPETETTASSQTEDSDTGTETDTDTGTDTETDTETDTGGEIGDCERFESNLPLVFVDTGNQFIPDDPKIDAELVIIDNGEGQTNCWGATPAFEGPIGIERRGSTSQNLPKHGYGVETRDEFGQDLNVSVLGMPTESDWVLYAPYSDKSMIRNVLAYHIFNEMGHYATRTRYVELFLDEQYWGIYVWEEKVKRDPERVPITKIEPTDVVGDAVTGGYILKVDKFTGNVGANWVSPYSNEVRLQVHYPSANDVVPAQAAYIEGAVTAMEDALASPDFADPMLGYAAHIDVASFIDFMILQELSRPVDGYRSSAFFYKDRDSINSKFVAGPAWDFNVAFGNADYCLGFSTTGYQFNFEDVCGQQFNVEVPFWWERLLQDPAFANALRCRWEELRAGLLSDASIEAFVEAQAALLAEAQVRNFERWPILGTYVDWNYFVGETWEEELDYLLSWTAERAAWLDANFGGTC